jgi:hypothetical protein
MGSKVRYERMEDHIRLTIPSSKPLSHITLTTLLHTALS